MVVKAVIEWQGPAGFDDDVAIAVAPCRDSAPRRSTSSTRRPCNDAPACVGAITYVSVIPGTHDSTPIPQEMRATLGEHA